LPYLVLGSLTLNSPALLIAAADKDVQLTLDLLPLGYVH
jgi:hypothetical protein